MKNLIFAAILMVVTVKAQSQISKNDPVKIISEFKEINSKEITDTINISGEKESLIFGFADIDVSNLDREKVRSIVKDAKSVQEIINKVGPVTLMAESELPSYQETTTVSGFYYSFVPNKYDPSYVELVMVWPLKN